MLSHAPSHSICLNAIYEKNNHPVSFGRGNKKHHSMQIHIAYIYIYICIIAYCYIILFYDLLYYIILHYIILYYNIIIWYDIPLIPTASVSVLPWTGSSCISSIGGLFISWEVFRMVKIATWHMWMVMEVDGRHIVSAYRWRMMEDIVGYTLR